MSSHAADRVKVEYVLERIAKVVQCITCAAGASTTQSLATSLTRFAKTVSASVAFAQAAALAVTTQMGALKTVIIGLNQGLGAAHVRYQSQQSLIVCHRPSSHITSQRVNAP